MPDHSTTEWESETTRLVRYTTHERGVNFPLNYKRSAKYWEEPGRRVRRIIVHQSAGNRRDGISAVDRMANWIVRAPKFEKRRGKIRRVGGGRGFPAIPYTFMIPHRPDIIDGKSVVYRLWDDSWHTWHTRRANRDGVGICFAGSFRTRHNKRFSDNDPTTQALAAGEDLVMNYLMPRYSLKPDDVCGHFDFGKSGCPGDTIEAWIRRKRGERVDWYEPLGGDDQRPLDPRSLRTRDQQNTALTEIGYGDGFDLADIDDRKLAIEAFQYDEGLIDDGLWGPNTEKAMRLALAE